MSRHRLRREIISTILSNEIVNMCGADLRLAPETVG
jgi:NAD-specific glutamate dehydrogenase